MLNILHAYAYQFNISESNAEVCRINMQDNSTGKDANVQLTQMDWNGYSVIVIIA